MAHETFVDTSGLYAILVRTDENHESVRKILLSAGRTRGLFITTDYVLDETATLLKARGHAHLLDDFFNSVFSSKAIRVEWMDHERFMEVHRFFLKHKDQSWSFTDCFSFFLMKKLKLTRALTKDHHFIQAGFTPIL